MVFCLCGESSVPLHKKHLGVRLLAPAVSQAATGWQPCARTHGAFSHTPLHWHARDTGARTPLPPSSHVASRRQPWLPGFSGPAPRRAVVAEARPEPGSLCIRSRPGVSCPVAPRGGVGVHIEAPGRLLHPPTRAGLSNVNSEAWGKALTLPHGSCGTCRHPAPCSISRVK